MERWVERLLPYWSVAINTLLCLALLADSVGGSSPGRNYAALISAVSDVLAGSAR